MPRNFSRVVNRDNFTVPFTIRRSSGGSFGPGGWQDQTTDIPANGIIAPADDQALQQIPEGDRVSGSLQLVITEPVYNTSEQRPGLSDKIVWQGETYKLVGVQQWVDYGYWTAILVRMAGN